MSKDNLKRVVPPGELEIDIDYTVKNRVFLRVEGGQVALDGVNVGDTLIIVRPTGRDQCVIRVNNGPEFTIAKSELAKTELVPTE